MAFHHMHHRSNPLALALACGALGLALPPAAQAQDSPWSLRAGPAAVNFAARSGVEVAGTAVPGGEVQVQRNTTLAMELGYALDARWTTRLAFGVPPTTRLGAGGSLRALVPPLTGTLGRVQYAPAVLSLTCGLGDWAALRPYVGVGINYTWITASRDADLAGLQARSAWGSALQAGVDVPLGRQWSLFMDLRQVFVKTSASGTVPALGGPAAKASVTLDPLIAHLGMGYRF
jgi:outer membrane protein